MGYRPTGLAMRPRRGRTWFQRSVIALNVVLIMASLTSAWALWMVWNRAESINRVALDRSLTAVPPDAERGERVINVLLVGSDSSAGLDPDDPVQIDRQGERFGDVIIIAHIDERSGSVALLSLPRDLWVEIGSTGRDGRINRAFVNGGPALLIETIERQFDLPIHHYVNVDFAGFQGLVEAIGSVDVWFETPARDWNVNAKPVPRTQTGFLVETAGCHSLDPEMALAYVRSRYYQTQDENGSWRTDPTADLGRIERQQDFLRRAMSRAIEVGARNPFVLRDLVDTGLEHVAIDQELTPQFLVDLGGMLRSFEPDDLQTYSFPNRPTTIGANQVLIPRPDEADAVLALFRGDGFDAPSTVDLRVVRNADSPNDGLRALRQAGFRPVVERDEEPLAAGTVLRHGPDGRPAADLVEAALGQPVVVEQAAWLTGRTVELQVGPDPDPVDDEPEAGTVGQFSDTPVRPADPATDASGQQTSPTHEAAADEDRSGQRTVEGDLPQLEPEELGVEETTQAGGPGESSDDDTMTTATLCG